MVDMVVQRRDGRCRLRDHDDDLTCRFLKPVCKCKRRRSSQITSQVCRNVMKVKKVSHTRLPSAVFRSWSRYLAVSLQVTWVINPAVGCYYFPPGLQLPSQPLRGLLPISLLRGTMGVNSLPKTVTRQRRDCDLNPGPSAPESSTPTTRLPSHPKSLQTIAINKTDECVLDWPEWCDVSRSSQAVGEQHTSR